MNELMKGTWSLWCWTIYRTKNNLPKEQKDSSSKLNKLTEERKIVICRADKDEIIFNCEDYNAIMIKELQQYEKMYVPVEVRRLPEQN